MQNKIDWYQEVIDLEPSSKLFFPLAKMLSESDVPRAVETLQRGLDRHPEFIEARFYFVDLLHKNKDLHDYAARLKTQLSLLSPTLMRYAGFWHAWGDSILNETEQMSLDEKGLAVAFMGAMFDNKNISLANIFSEGLRAVMGKEAQKYISEPQASVQPPQTTELPNDLASPAEVPASLKSAIENVESNDIETDEPEEQFSLRTRSMAEVLAEQGDFNSALDIYEELVQAANNDGEKQDLRSRITTLKAMSGSGSDQGARIAAKDVAANQKSDVAGNKENKISSPGKERVISVLAKLADNLETRAHS